MNKPLSESDLATPKVTTGPIAGSRKAYATPGERAGPARAGPRDRAVEGIGRAAAAAL